MSKNLKLTERGGIWYLVRRIPKRYESVETRTRIVSISLETDSLSAARRKADDVWQAQLDHWQGKLEGRSADDRSAYDAIRKLAQRRGFSYLPVSQVAKLPDDELLARLGAVPETGGRVDPDELAALMGTVESPSLMMSEVWEEFYRLTANRRLHKSRDQVRKWESPFKRALNRWLDVNGDSAVDGLNHDDFISDPTHVRPITVLGLQLYDKELNKKCVCSKMLLQKIGKMYKFYQSLYILPISRSQIE